MERLEQLEVFHSAKHIALYHAMSDEVQTASFVRKWAFHKTIYLPVICGDRIELYPYTAEEALKPGVFGILEPVPHALTEKPSPDLIIVPGVAFDRHMNRMGRGKGYYDRLLIEEELRGAIKVGLCFDFQLVDEVPSTAEDIRMDMLVTNKEVIVPR